MELDWREAIVLGAALRDGLVEAVAEGSVPASGVAEKLGLDGRAVYVALSALAELGVLEESAAGFALRDKHRGPLLDPGHSGYVGQSVVHRFELIGTWSRLPEVLKTGEPVEDRTRPGFGGTENFIAAMRHNARPGAEPVARLLLPRLPEGARILDVGGGPGPNAEAFARGRTRVTVLDRPEVISQMREPLAAAGIETVAGDMFEGLPEGPFDAVYFGNTSHMYGPEENRELFGRMRRVLVPGGLLAVRDYLRGVSRGAALFAVNMLVLTPNGGTYAADDYARWLREAGFTGFEVVEVPERGAHLVLARNPR